YRRGLLWLVGPPLWALLEWVRSNGELGFPWAAIGYSFARIPALLQGASFVGITGIGAFIILVNMVVCETLLTRNVKTKSIWIVVSMALLILAGVFGKYQIADFDRVPRGVEYEVAVVQPNVDLAVKWKPEFTDYTFRLIERLSRQAARSGPGLIVFPETSAPVYLRHSLKDLMRVQKLAADLDTGVFIGFLDGRYDGPGGTLRVYNSAGLISPDGRIQVYDKMHLLPFGEAIPFAWKYPGLAKIDFGQANFTPGPPIPPIESKIGRLAPLVCFESIFPGLSRRFTRLGAQILVNVTNDGWFGDTPGPYQHNDMAILRAHGDLPVLIGSLIALSCGAIAAGLITRRRRASKTRG
ncbi:MAG: apolipoprotein N-acyltransferase, partial [bacterium]